MLRRFRSSLVAVVVASSCLVPTGCSGGGGGSPATPAPEAVEDRPLERSDALTLTGISPDTFNPLDVSLRFAVRDTTFATDIASFALLVNDVLVPNDTATLGSATFDIGVTMVDGRNDVTWVGYDAFGRPLFLRGTYWCGGQTLTANLVDGGGDPVLGPVDVRFALADDADVAVTTSTTTGSVAVANLPSRTMVLAARTADNRAGTAGAFAGDGSVQLRILSFSNASKINNNNLSQGLAGWSAGAAASIVTHQEGPPPGFAGLGNDNDVRLITIGEGPQTLARTFTVAPGKTSVSVRYRFVTSEVPGGFFGTQFNDYFSVTLRAQNAGAIVGESQTMNGLGLEAFDPATGATAWRSRTLPVSGGEVVQLDVTVANVGDGQYDSFVEVDFIAENEDRVTPTLAWNPVAGGLDLGFTVAGSTLTDPVTISVAWARGTTYADRLDTFFTFEVPAGTPVGPGGPVLVSGGSLADALPSTTHVLASTSESNVVSLPDVRIRFAATANEDVVPLGMQLLIRDGLRAAGVAECVVTSTARTPGAQARVMFQNLVRPPASIAQNVQSQQSLYAPPGDAVIAVFVQLTQGQSREQILANAPGIKAAMEAKIVELGPNTVSKHCADPNLLTVLDVGKAAFPPAAAQRFVAAVQPYVTVLLDEGPPNNAFHLQRPAAQ